MYSRLTIIRKKPNVTTGEFRHFMEHVYGPTYAGLPETREYVQYYLTDDSIDGAEEPIDAVVQISFDSREEMVKALEADRYKRASKAREDYMRETSAGIHSTVIDKIVKLV